MKINIKEIAVFGMLGAVMYISKMLMEALPNMHLIGVFIVAITVVYRKKALYPIYIFVFLTGLIGGFNLWWVPYLYIWTVLWGVVMLLPRKMPKTIEPFVYMIVCSIHGFLFGVLYSIFQALVYGLDFNGMLAWIAAGATFDVIHGVSNFVLGILIVPLIRAMRYAENRIV